MKQRFTEPEIVAIPEEEEAGGPISMTSTKGFQSPGLPYSICKPLKSLVGPPGFELGTKGLWGTDMS